MNITSSVRVAFEQLRVLAFGGITNVYAPVGGPFLNPVRMLIIHNTTNVGIIVSYDGVTPASYIPATSSRVLDYGSNMADKAGLLEQPAYQSVYVITETINPTSGNVYVEVIYASDAA
jgi:hypothetical protein